jgi:hypothetical protein
MGGGRDERRESTDTEKKGKKGHEEGKTPVFGFWFLV